MDNKIRYFRCNILGGFRLSDLNKNIRQGHYFQLENHIVETSKAVKAAIKAKWMVEISENEAEKHFDLPKKRVQKKKEVAKPHSSRGNQVSIPDTKDVERRIESGKIDKTDGVSVPNFKEVEKKNKEKLIKKEDPKVSTPDQNLTKEKVEKKNSEVNITSMAKEESIVNDDRPLAVPPIINNLNKKEASNETNQEEKKQEKTTKRRRKKNVSENKEENKENAEPKKRRRRRSQSNQETSK